MQDGGTGPLRGHEIAAEQVIVVGTIAMVVAGASNLIFAAARRTAGHDQSTGAVLTIVCACVIVLVIVRVKIVQVSAVLVQVSNIASKA